MALFFDFDLLDEAEGGLVPRAVGPAGSIEEGEARAAGQTTGRSAPKGTPQKSSLPTVLATDRLPTDAPVTQSVVSEFRVRAEEGAGTEEAKLDGDPLEQRVEEQTGKDWAPCARYEVEGKDLEEGQAKEDAKLDAEELLRSQQAPDEDVGQIVDPKVDAKALEKGADAEEVAEVGAEDAPRSQEPVVEDRGPMFDPEAKGKAGESGADAGCAEREKEDLPRSLESVEEDAGPTVDPEARRKDVENCAQADGAEVAKEGPPRSQEAFEEDAGPTIDEARWKALVVEPSAGTLAKWAGCELARDVLRQFVLEDAIGEADSIQFKEVYRLLEVLSLTPAALVAKFAGEAPVTAIALEAMADRILARFASSGSQSSMRFRDLYRMLEVVGVSLYKLLSKFVDDCSDLHVLLDPRSTVQQFWRFGNFLVSREIGSGFRGPCCYLAEHATTRQRAAVKWPVAQAELAILQEIHKQALSHPGLPRVLACGYFDGDCYVITDLLGSPLSKVLGRLQDHPLESRWAALRVIGRLLLRRLKAVHSAGYVHCDMSPENVLLGRAHFTPASPSKHTLYLVDFGLARRGGSPLQGCEGSNEWSSIRSADGGPRFPDDDVESLGWVLAYGLFGELPWNERLAEAYADWHSASVREAAVREVKEAKLQLLEGGWDSHSGRWQKLADIPEELDRFLRAAALPVASEAPDAPPDYARLLGILGEPAGASGGLDAEERDLRDYHDLVAPLL